jgi:hypothetical protein
MKKLILFAFAAALIVPLVGQEAKIMIVEKYDSQRLARAYEKYKQAQAEWNETKAQVARFYTSDHGKTMDGWEKVQFSADFRAIVPDASQYAYHTFTGCVSPWTLNSGGAITTIPMTNGTVLGGDILVDSDLTVKEKK